MEVHKIISAASVAQLQAAEESFLATCGDLQLTFKRYFVSCRQQVSELGHQVGPVSYVIQPVLGEEKVAVWLYLTKDCPVELVWHTNVCSTASGSEAQTAEILQAFEDDLESSGMSISNNCVRTWFYVDDIDTNYHGVVVGRSANFARQGMTKDTHYLASTGIYGGAVVPDTIVQMDALSIKGDFSQHYLYAPTNFNPTHEYGVTFERGVVLEYGHESHVLISGTASINNRGEIVFPGDVKAQTRRMWENVQALLSEAGSTWDDVRMMLVYLRNAADYDLVAPLFRDKFADCIPYVITHAPVCRPGWLVEMECIAIKDNSNNQ